MIAVCGDAMPLCRENVQKGYDASRAWCSTDEVIARGLSIRQALKEIVVLATSPLRFSIDRGCSRKARRAFVDKCAAG